MNRMRAILLSCLLLSSPLQAHTLSVSHLDIVVPPQGGDMRVELDIALKDVALSLPLDADRDEKVTWGELKAIRAPLEHWVVSNLVLSVHGRPCRLVPTELATRRYDEGTYATVVLVASCTARDRLHVHYGLLFDVDPQHRALVTLRDGSAVATRILSADAPDADVGAAASHPFLDFLREGIHHILIGYDHLAFLLSLLLPAALIRKRHGWLPSPGLRDSFKHVLGIVTAFTIAHSITLSLAALGWITPASRWVEAAIAASVLVAALNNVWPVVVRRVWLVAFSFGLIHGFGFAGALSELGLPDRARLAALVGFNLGVEIGQLLIVCLILPLLYAMRNKRWYPRFVMPLASSVIAALAAWWMYLRLGA